MCIFIITYWFAFSESVSTKYQLVVDLAGAFGEEFAKIEVPLKQFNLDMALLGKRVQETQRDLTLRKCIIEKAEVASLTSQYVFKIHYKTLKRIMMIIVPFRF